MIALRKPRLFFGGLVLFFISLSAPGDILLDGDYTAIGWGYGVIQRKAIHWTPCHQATTNFPAPPYRLIPREHECDHVSPAAFGLKKSQGSLRISDLETSQILFPEGRLGDRVDFDQTSASISLRLRDRVLEIPKDGVTTGGARFVSYLSAALGLKRAGDPDASNIALRQAVKELRVLDSGIPFGPKRVATNAASLLGKLSLPNSDEKSEASMLFIEFANSQSNRLPRPAQPSDAHPTEGAFGIEGTGQQWSKITVRALGDGAAFTLMDADKYKYALSTTTIKDSYVEGGVQILDSLTWDNVTFVNTRIYYFGAPVSLKNMHFIKCRFFVQAGLNGADFLEFASSDPGNVNKVIGPGNVGF